MAKRLPSFVPRVAGLALFGLAATATLTYAAGRDIGPAASKPTVEKPAAPTRIVVPDVRNQAFVFAKGSLEDAGFAWRVSGSVHGFASNTVLSQSPAAGTKLYDTGAPLVTVTLKRNAAYAQAGAAQDASPYAATAVVPTATAGLGPAAPATTTSRTPAARPAKVAPKQAPTVKPETAAAASPKSRPAAFTVPGGRTEPLDEMPLTSRAQALGRWLDAHPTKTPASVAHWLYQNEWIVAGAKLGWWHGAAALTTLIAVDRHAQSLWGVGAKSALLARQALSEVQSRSQ